MKHAKIFAAFLVVFVLSTTACWKASSDAQITTSEPATTQQPVGGTTPGAETKYFSGSIGDSLQVQMRLLRRGDQLSGSYFYQKVGTQIDLRGTIDQNGNVAMDEFDPSGKQTGNFQGKWASGADGQVTVSGSWSKPNSQSKMPFSLQEQPIHFEGDIEIVAKQIKQSNKSPKYEIFAEYPELTGAIGPNHQKFNRDVRNLIQKKAAGFRKDVSDPEAYVAEGMGNDLSIGYVVGLANDDLISIEFDVGSYYSGAAHPNSYSEAVNYDLKNGKTILLGDLFKPGTNYLKTIAAYCIKDLKQQSKAQDGMLDDDWIEKGAAAKAENYESWTITKKGLAITFDAYQVGPYAAGPQHVVVPYSIVKDIVAPAGPLAKLVK